MQRKRTYEYKLAQVDKVAGELSEVIDPEQVYQLYMLYGELSELGDPVVYRTDISLKEMVAFNSYSYLANTIYRLQVHWTTDTPIEPVYCAPISQAQNP